MSRSVLLQFLGGAQSWHRLRRWINLWPPFLGARIRIKHIAADMKAIDVEMKLRFRNANYAGTHFGGSLFAMTDPFYMLMSICSCCWQTWAATTSSEIRRQASVSANPGKGTVRAEFRLTDAQWDDIRDKLKTRLNMNRCFRLS